MTALRVTPISAAIWLQVMPAPTKARSCATRSGFQVSLVDGVVMRKRPSRAMPRPVLGRRQGEGRAQPGAWPGRTGALIGARRRACGRDHRAAAPLLKRFSARRFLTRTHFGVAFKVVV